LLPFSSAGRGTDAAVAASHFEAAEVARGEGLAALARSLADPDPSVRIRSLEVICEFSEDRAARLLAGMLHDPEPVVRCEAAGAAARLRASGVIFSLILALDDPRPEVRTASARAIAEITGREMPRDGIDGAEDRSRLVEELKSWWKEERFTQLATAVNVRPPK
jgi:HEAT repeat protein